MESNRDLYLSYSTDGGRTFSANRKVASEVCPCCKTALAVSADGTLYAGWRQVLPGSFRHPSLSVDRSSGSLKVIWYAAGEGNEPGIYLAESNDKGRTFTPRQLLSQENVRGTPALTANHDNAIALWQTSDTAETKMRGLGNTGAALSVAAGAELPTGVFSNDKLFVAYIGKEKEKRSIWLIRAE